MKRNLPSRTTLICLDLLWCAVILVLCLMPGDQIPKPGISIPYIDKIVHFGMFFIASFLAIPTLKRYYRLEEWKHIIITMIYICLLGGLTEYLQEFYFNRNGDIYDLAADILGGATACICHLKLNWN